MLDIPFSLHSNLNTIIFYPIDALLTHLELFYSSIPCLIFVQMEGVVTRQSCRDVSCHIIGIQNIVEIERVAIVGAIIGHDCRRDSA